MNSLGVVGAGWSRNLTAVSVAAACLLLMAAGSYWPITDPLKSFGEWIDSLGSFGAAIVSVLGLLLLNSFGEFLLQTGTTFRRWVLKKFGRSELIEIAMRADNGVLIEEYERVRRQIELQDGLLGACLSAPMLYIPQAYVFGGGPNLVVVFLVLFFGLCQPIGSAALIDGFKALVDQSPSKSKRRL